MSQKLPFWKKVKNGYGALYNENLALVKNPKEAEAKTKREWDAMSQDEKTKRNNAAHAKWQEENPPPPPETPEEKVWRELEAKEVRRLRNKRKRDNKKEKLAEEDYKMWEEMGGNPKKPRGGGSGEGSGSGGPISL